MTNNNVLDFIVTMCETGEAARYQIRKHDAAAEQFAADLAEQAKYQLTESRILLKRVKARVKNFGVDVLCAQINETLGADYISKVDAGFMGIYEWTVNLHSAAEPGNFGEVGLQLKFGPSAWYANESDRYWTDTVDPAEADYPHIFITRSHTGTIRQSSVSICEVLNGLEPTDRRLHDEIMQILA